MSGKRKHVPERTCVVCREKYEKRRLFRLVATEEGIVVDQTGRQVGRGAYLCMKRRCWEQAVHTQSIAKALKITLTEADRLYLSQYLHEHINP